MITHALFHPLSFIHIALQTYQTADISPSRALDLSAGKQWLPSIASEYYLKHKPCDAFPGQHHFGLLCQNSAWTVDPIAVKTTVETGYTPVLSASPVGATSKHSLSNFDSKDSLAIWYEDCTLAYGAAILAYHGCLLPVMIYETDSLASSHNTIQDTVALLASILRFLSLERYSDHFRTNRRRLELV